MLPDSQDAPSRRFQPLVRVAISILIPLQLWAPVPTVRAWIGRTMDWAAVPKTTVDEYRYPCTTKHDVNSTSKCPWNDGNINSEAKPKAVQFLANGQLRLSVTARLELHFAPCRR